MRRILLLFLYIFCWSVIQAQDLPTYIKQADSIAASGQWKEALRWYDRIRYFDETGQYHPQLFKKIGLIRMSQQEYTRAAASFESGYFSTTDNSEKSDFLILKTRALMHAGQFEDALMELSGLKGKPIHDSAQYYMYLSTCLAMMEQTDSAVTIWKRYVSDDAKKSGVIDSIRLALIKANHISPKKAATLSRLLPGLGQCYARRYGPAINSFLLVGGLATVFYLTAYNYTVLDAMIGVFPWFQRYYAGGSEKAAFMALDRKQKLQKQAISKAIQIVF